MHDRNAILVSIWSSETEQCKVSSSGSFYTSCPKNKLTQGGNIESYDGMHALKMNGTRKISCSVLSSALSRVNRGRIKRRFNQRWSCQLDADTLAPSPAKMERTENRGGEERAFEEPVIKPLTRVKCSPQTLQLVSGTLSRFRASDFFLAREFTLDICPRNVALKIRFP